MTKFSGQNHRKHWLRLAIRLSLTTLFLLACLLSGPLLLSLFFPFLGALLVVWLLDPVICFFQIRLGGSRRFWSLFLLLSLSLLLGGCLTGLLYHGFLELRDLIRNWQTLWEGLLPLSEALSLWREMLFPTLPASLSDRLTRLVDRLLADLRTTILPLLSDLLSGIGAAALRLPSTAIAFVAFAMASYFILADYPSFRRRALRHLSADTIGLFRFIKYAASAALGGYVRAQFLLSLAVFLILLAGFTLIGQEYALLLALVLAIMDFIPIIGAGTLMLPWVLLRLLARQFSGAARLLAVWCMVALFRRVAEPRLVGRQTGLSPLLSLTSLYAGMQLGGVPGMILGPVLLLVLIQVGQAGVFDGVLADLRLALGDIQSMLKPPP